MYSYQKRESKLKKIISTIILIIIVSAASIFLYDMYLKIEVTPNNLEYQTSPDAIRLSNNSDEKEQKVDIVTTLEDACKSVVGISKIRNAGESILASDSTTNLGLGSGIIVSNDGYIITNWHVAGNKYSNCYVTLENGETHNGSILWADSDLDLAVVKINTNGLDYLSFGNSSDLKLGDKVYAIGNPIGIEFQRTVTSGIISGLNRTVKIEEENDKSYMEDLIQTDATINPGNSGGPLINENGEVIGINSIKITTAEGIGFAIPINTVKPIINSFIETGKFEEAYLGIFAYDKEVIPYLTSNLEFDSGIYVAQISKNGPCYNSELKVGDIIKKIDDVVVNKMSELRDYIYKKQVGDIVTLNISRNNKTYDINIKLGKK